VTYHEERSSRALGAWIDLTQDLLDARAEVRAAQQRLTAVQDQYGEIEARKARAWR
jgi:hypothetical protein